MNEDNFCVFLSSGEERGLYAALRSLEILSHTDMRDPQVVAAGLR